ncbi:MAG TPA: YraN family protein [Solirubrobacteraceae bacterium]
MTALRGEHLAAMHLSHRGYEILARNVRTSAGEIDLIARRGEVLAFVEVKTARIRRADGAGATPDRRPLESLRYRQRVRIRRAAAAWLREGGSEQPSAGPASTLRFDAIGVVLDARWQLLRIDHIEAAW